MDKQIEKEFARTRWSALGNHGLVLALILSYNEWQCCGWAAFHALFSWFYVIYWAIFYGN